MHLTGIEHFLVDAAAVAGLVMLLALLAVTLAATMVIRRSRRRWRVVRGLISRRSRGGPLSRRPAVNGRALAASALGLTTNTVASPRWWATQNARRQMWREVTAAKHAVTVARRAGAPVGDLPALVRQLEGAARSADALAQADAHSPRRGRPATPEVRRVQRAALEVRDAAVDALQAAATAEVSPLLPSVRLEAAALAAGALAASTLRGPAS